MKFSAQIVSAALFVTLAIGLVSSQTNGTSTGTSTSTNSSIPAAGGAVPKKGLSGLRCYSCSSFLKQQSCDNPNEDTPIDDCAEGENMCRKVEQHINYNGDDHIRTFRECAKTGNLGECTERTGTYRFKSWYCQCKGDLCNGASNSVVSFTLITSMFAALFCLKNRI